MRSPALAFAWELRQRHRWGMIALAGYLAVIAAIKLLGLGPGERVSLDTPQSFALVVVVPLAATFTYFLAVFTFGLSGDIAARESMYPARMFTLPVTTNALVGLPMLYGTVAMSMLWFSTRLFAVWPAGVEVPVVWPALGAAALLAWTQALTWMPYGLPGLRVIVAVLWLAMIDTVVLLALHFNAREPVMLAILVPQLPLAYMVARVAVARARRGDVPDWRETFARPGQRADVLLRRGVVFSSPERAQAWFEWRRHGRSLPVFVGILLPCELSLLFLAGGDNAALVWLTLFGVLCTPPVMAAFAAATVRRANPHAGDAHGLSPFIATRPLTSAALIAAKLRATIWSTLAAWLLVLVAIPVALIASGTWPVIADRWSRLSGAMGSTRATVLVLLGVALLMAATWKQLVQGLYIGLSGRPWLVKGSVFLTLTVLAAIGPIDSWLGGHRDVQVALWNAIPLILAALVVLKLTAAAWIGTRLFQSRLLSDGVLVAGAACWCAMVFALYGVLTWLFYVPFTPRYLFGLAAVLAIPLARLSAAPLALARNRHR